MIVYSFNSAGQLGAASGYTAWQPTYPAVYPGAPPPPTTPTTWTADMSVQPGGVQVTSPTTRSGDALVNYTDTWGVPTPETKVPGMTPVVDPLSVTTDPVFAPELAPDPRRRIGLSPVGLMALGAGLVGAWAVFRKKR